MKIEIVLKLDKHGNNHPYWEGTVKDGETTLMTIVSQTFNIMDDQDMKDRYENCTVRLIRELMEQKDFSMIKYLLTQN